MKKYDERNTLFSRVNLEKDSDDYKEYYNDKPLQKEKDDLQRRLPFRHKLRKNDRYKELFFPITQHNKIYIKNLFDTSNAYPTNEKRIDVPAKFSSNIKEITKYYGATTVGITELNDSSYYSHQGGLSEFVGINNYGEKVVPKFKTAIVFTVKMDLEMINKAPNFEELLATEEGYVKVAAIGARLEMYLKSLGYKSQSMNSELYLAPLVPLAYDAGLGEIGMCNHIVTKEFGNNIRLGAVFTNLEVDYDKPVDFGLFEFCKKCALCLMNCPSKAITHKERIVNGRRFYKFDDNKCFDLWLKAGTDCGTCISSCPFTQKLDLDKVDKMKENPEIMDEILNDFYQKYGRRPYQKGDLDIVKVEEDE
ncbi:4Fe-4S dicluster domain-containing protein [Candidatus Izimaplasma bacterium]|nr:4Fe-4S dicluster domain-containing protein [Candidatus Izimaplasma bacterium]